MTLMQHVGDIYQDLHGRRLDGDVDGVQAGLFDPLHSLDIHIQDADFVHGQHVFYGSFTGDSMRCYSFKII